MAVKKIMVAGGGVLGTQIAFQSAFCGIDTVIWLRSENFFKETQAKLDEVKNHFIEAVSLMATEEGRKPENWCNGISDFDTFNKEELLKKIEEARNSIVCVTDLKEAAEGKELIVESIPENQDIKTAFFKMLGTIVGPETVVVTSSSTFVPSMFAKVSGIPERFLSLHFSNKVWKNNIAEIMVHPGTSTGSFNLVYEYAKQIRMMPLPIRKENKGYLLNAMLLPFMFSALNMVVKGISDPQSIDTAWKVGTGAPRGPFEIADAVGLKAVNDIVANYLKIPSFLAPYDFKGIYALIKSYLDAGKLGRVSGEGFYKYK